MPSIFQEAAIRASAAVDAVYGESFHVAPMQAGRFQNGSAPDADRAAFDAIGAFHDGPDLIKMLSSTIGRDLDRKFLVAKTFVTFDIDTLAGRVIAPPDQVTRTEGPGALTYEVVSSVSDGVRRMIYALALVNS